MIEIETTIRGGLPVRVEGTVTRGEPPLPVPGEAMAVLCPGWETTAEIEAVRFKSGHRFPIAIPSGFSDAERERLEDELIEAAKAE